MSRIFLHLLNVSITAGWIVLVVVLLRLVLRRAPKWIRVAAWGLVALRLLLPVTVESILSLVPSAETVQIEAVKSEPASVPANVEEAAFSQSVSRVEGERIVIRTGLPAVNSLINQPAEKAAEHVDTVAVLKTVAGWVWLGGAIAMLLYALISYLRLRLRVRASIKVEKGIYVCDGIRDPFILGFIFPRIYLPSGMDETTKACVLAHERTHLKRFDHIWKPFGFLLLSVYWFNPLLWLAYILLCRDIELACDEKVIKDLPDEGKAAYSEALLSVSVSRRSIAVCPLAFGETGVKSRVKSILNYKKPTFWIILVAILAGIIVAVCFLTVPKKNKGESEPDSTAAPVDDSEAVSVPSGEVKEWLDYYSASSELPWEQYREIAIDAFPTVRFRWTSGSVEAVDVLSGVGKSPTLFSGMPVWNVYFADVTGDGRPELLSTVSFGSGVIDEHIVVYDYENKQSYTLWDRFVFDYHLYLAGGKLLVGKMPYNGDKQVDYGTLVMHDGVLCCQWHSDGSFTPLRSELHESELYGYWLVEEETDNAGNVLYSKALDLWKEYNFREDGTVIYNETVPISSNSELAFGHPVSYPYEVHDDFVYIAGDDTSGAFRFGQYDREIHRLTLMYNTSDGTVYATLRRMDAGAQSEAALDEAALCTTWQLTEIEAPDGSSGDPKGILIEEYFEFRTDGTAHFIERNGENYSQTTLPYSLDGNTVTTGGFRLDYDSTDQTLSIRDPHPDDIAVWIFTRTPNAKLPIKEAALVGTWIVESMDLDGTDVTNDAAYRKYRDLKIELYRSGTALIYGAGERWNGSGFTWVANDEDGISDLAVTLRNNATGVACSLAINGDYEINDGLLSAFGDYFFSDGEPDLYILFERDPLTPLPSASIVIPAGTDTPQTEAVPDPALSFGALQESDLYGGWLVKEERDGDGNALFAFDSLGLWKEYDFLPDGTVRCNEHELTASDEYANRVYYPYSVQDGKLRIENGLSTLGSIDSQTGNLILSCQSSGKAVYATLTRWKGVPQADRLLTQEQADAFVNGLSVEIEDGSPYGCDLVVFIDGFGTFLNVGDPNAFAHASLRFEVFDKKAESIIYTKYLDIDGHEYYLGDFAVLAEGNRLYCKDCGRGIVKRHSSEEASIFVTVSPSLVERNREVTERACVIKAFDAGNRTVTVSYVSFDEPKDGYSAEILYDTVEEEEMTLHVTDNTFLSVILWYDNLVKPDRFFRYLEENRYYLNGVDDGTGDDRGIGFWIGLDGDTLLYLCEVYEE